MEKKIIFLGTSSVYPTKERNHPSVYLQFRDEKILFDCGEGTQKQLTIQGIPPTRITRIFLTHWHGDHVLGIPGLLQTLGLSGYNKTFFIYGPRGTKKFMKEILNVFHFTGNYQIKVKEVSGK